eukprot:1358390-Pleurochrysis_carterae.AAC.1
MPQARAKGSLPCAWRALFGACEKQASGECDNCRYAEGLPLEQRPEAPPDLVERVKAACSAPLQAIIR